MKALNDDTDLYESRYPLFGVSGYCINGPFFGDLIRQAREIGFKIIPYEYRGAYAAGMDPVSCQNQREQARRRISMIRILKSDPEVKILVHAGYSHIAKMGTPEWIPMAKYFWQISGIEPHAIEQTRSIAKEVAHPTVFRSKDGHYWAGVTKNFDMAVIHPRDKESIKRPAWTSGDGHRGPSKRRGPGRTQGRYILRSMIRDQLELAKSTVEVP